MVTWISERLKRYVGGTDRRRRGSEAIEMEKLRELRRRTALAAATRQGVRRDPEPDAPFRERGSQLAVRRAVLAALDQDDISGLRRIPHAWPVTREHLRLVARQLEGDPPPEPPPPPAPTEPTGGETGGR